VTQINAAQPQPAFEATATALREKSKLRRHFRRFDMFFYLICTVVTIDTIGAVASNGAQGFTWLIFLGIFFFLPAPHPVSGRPGQAVTTGKCAPGPNYSDGEMTSGGGWIIAGGNPGSGPARAPRPRCPG
jgi:hypothetical protein